MLRRRLAKLSPYLMVLVLLLLVMSRMTSPDVSSVTSTILELQRFQKDPSAKIRIFDLSGNVLTVNSSSSNTTQKPKIDPNDVRYLFDTREQVQRT